MAVGDQVEGFYVLKTAQIRTSNNGRPFLAAVVSDKTGSMEAKAWDYSGPISTADEGQMCIRDRSWALAIHWRNTSSAGLSGLLMGPSAKG